MQIDVWNIAKKKKKKNKRCLEYENGRHIYDPSVVWKAYGANLIRCTLSIKSDVCQQVQIVKRLHCSG